MMSNGDGSMGGSRGGSMGGGSEPEEVRDPSRFYDEGEKKLPGEIVLSRYGPLAYRIDDSVWDKYPTNCFELADGSKMTYLEYYKAAYEKPVKDDQQPLLISRPKAKL